MNKAILGLIVGMLIGAGAVWLAVPRRAETHDTEKKGEEKSEHKSESRLVHTNDETWVRLDEHSREMAGLKLEEVRKVTTTPEIKAYGRVLDPSSLAGLAIEIATARAALDASKSEFNRLKGLHAQGQNVSTHALETAEAAWKRDEVALQSAQLRLLTGWGKQIAELPDLPAFVRSLAALDTCLARLDVPLGEGTDGLPGGARIATLENEARALPARYLGPIATVDAQSQGRGFLFLMETNALPPGANVIGWLTIPGERSDGLNVPASAIVRHEGETFVYVAQSDELFARERIEMERPSDDGWLVKGELRPGSKVVIKGAQELLSEELKAQTAEE